MSPSSDIEDFRNVLCGSKNIIAIAGAGLSVASGIPTWRDSGGVWRTYDPSTIATPTAFAKDPSLVWQHYHAMRDRALQAAPNAAHLALALFCIPQLRSTIAPLARFTLVTQNIDGLSTRALEMTHEKYKVALSNPVPESQSSPPNLSPKSLDTHNISRIYEMHGRVLDTLCTFCGHREHNTTTPLCPTLGNAELGSTSTTIPVEDLPRCTLCGGLLRPGVVWFDEIPHHSREIWEVVDSADLCLLIGTSSQVQPAAAYAYEVRDRGGKVAVFNIRQSEGEEADYVFLGPCEETLPQILLNM